MLPNFSRQPCSSLTHFSISGSNSERSVLGSIEADLDCKGSQVSQQFQKSNLGVSGEGGDFCANSSSMRVTPKHTSHSLQSFLQKCWLESVCTTRDTHLYTCGLADACVTTPKLNVGQIKTNVSYIFQRIFFSLLTDPFKGPPLTHRIYQTRRTPFRLRRKKELDRHE